MTEISAQGKTHGTLMQRETAQAPTRFIDAIQQDLSGLIGGQNGPLARADLRSIYTIARGSSDAAANILSYEIMQVLGVPVTSLPPSVFSLGAGVSMRGAAGLVISQSGASHDLLKSAGGIRAAGGQVVALTNSPNAPLAEIADAAIDIMAGPELAVPATKSVICTLGAGMALLRALAPDYGDTCAQAAVAFGDVDGQVLSQQDALIDALVSAQSLYVIGRGAGFGAAHEVALKFKECAALHAEAYSASEVLHGPLQLVKKRLTVLVLDTGEPAAQPSLDIAEARFNDLGATVFRLRPSDLGAGITAPKMSPAAAAALLLYGVYPVVRRVALTLGFDPDQPETLAKVTVTI
jgi:glucosamine--fructose-6-phosphate aminotransferase (isomerizing)